MSDSAPPMLSATSFVMISCQAKLHFLTGSQKNIFYQLAAAIFSMKKSGQFGRLH
jgi:hypothetical protein